MGTLWTFLWTWHRFLCEVERKGNERLGRVTHIFGRVQQINTETLRTTIKGQMLQMTAVNWYTELGMFISTHVQFLSQYLIRVLPEKWAIQFNDIIKIQRPIRIASFARNEAAKKFDANISKFNIRQCNWGWLELNGKFIAMTCSWKIHARTLFGKVWRHVWW